LTGLAWPYLVNLWSRKRWAEIVRAYGGFLPAHGRIPVKRPISSRAHGSWYHLAITTKRTALGLQSPSRLALSLIGRYNSGAFPPGAAYLFRLSLSPTDEDWQKGAEDGRGWLWGAIRRPAFDQEVWSGPLSPPHLPYPEAPPKKKRLADDHEPAPEDLSSSTTD
jgi:hypothetical protein